MKRYCSFVFVRSKIVYNFLNKKYKPVIKDHSYAVHANMFREKHRTNSQTAFVRQQMLRKDHQTYSKAACAVFKYV